MLGSTNIVAFVPITDANRSRAFYEGLLGLTFVRKTDSPSSSAPMAA